GADEPGRTAQLRLLVDPAERHRSSAGFVGSAQTLAADRPAHGVVIPTPPDGSVVRSLLGPDGFRRTGSAPMDLLNTLVDKGLRRETPTRAEALAVLATTDDELLDVVAAAGKVRRHWFGRRVKLNYLVNLK